MEKLELARLLELGVVSGAFIFMLRWMMTRFEKELKSINKSQVDCGKTIAALSVVIVSMQKQLLSHDLTVHGINPSTGADNDERARVAIKKYNELHTILNETSVTLSRLIE